MSKESNAIVCANCDRVYDAAIDTDFLLLNPPDHRKVYEDEGRKLAVSPPRYTSEAPMLPLCSTDCFASFIKNDSNRDRIAVMEPARLPPEPEETATAKERFARLFPAGVTLEQRRLPEFRAFEKRNVFHAHRRWEVARAGTLRCACSPETDGTVHLIECAIGDHGTTPCGVGAGPFFYLWNSLARTEFCFSGVACALRWAEAEANRFDAKGFWSERGIRCATCGSTYRTDLYGDGCGTLPLQVVRNGAVETLHFCSPTCALTKIESGHVDLVHVSFEEHVREGWQNHCHRCKRVNREARFIVVDPTPWNSGFDDEIGGHFDSTECFLEALRAEAARFAERNLDKWYVDHPHPLQGLPH